MSVSVCAELISREYGVQVKPRDISRLIYDRELRTDICRVEAGRRVIPENYVPMVVAALRRRGKLREAA